MRKQKDGRWEFRVFSRVTLNDEPADSRGYLWGEDPLGKTVPVPDFGAPFHFVFAADSITARQLSMAITHGFGPEEYMQLASVWWDNRLGVVPVDSSNEADVAACEKVEWINERRLAWLKSVGAKEEIRQ